MKILTLKEVGFQYDTKPVLENINMDFETGKLYAIEGPSGAGKSTLLSLISGLAKQQKGSILFNDQDIKNQDMYEYRSHKIGIIFQSYNLLNKLTALENVILSMDIAGVHKEDKVEHAKNLLYSVGLSDEEIARRVLKLSGGQQQRVAIARALSYDPQLILADEPTGNLDPKTRDEILNIFQKLKQEGKCIIVVTHAQEVADQADRVYTLKRII